MNNKDLYFISSILFLLVFAVIFYFLGKRAKNNKRASILTIGAIAVFQIAIINVVWIYGFDLGVIGKGLVSGLSGCMIGFVVGVIK